MEFGGQWPGREEKGGGGGGRVSSLDREVAGGKVAFEGVVKCVLLA